MNETRFTPGPWSAVNDGTATEPMMSVKAARIAGRPPRHEVALVATGDSPQEMETANAHLIAAAPTLYEALSAIIDACDRAGKDDDLSIVDTFTDAMEDAARAALAKARGEAQ